jgi:hypothetical protein
MANTDRPNGLRFVKSQIGAVQPQLRRYEAADRTADSTNNHGDIYIGDPVAISSGKVLPANKGDTVAGVVAAVGKTTTSFGETQPFNADDLGQRYLASGEAGYVWIVPAEGNLFEVQTAADVDLVPGSTADLNIVAATAHGDRTTGNSNVEISTASAADVIVVEQLLNVDNDTTLTNARHIVKFLTTAHPV